MEGLFDFLADNYIWFAGVSVFFAFALIGLVYETKKKKKAEKNTADAVAQPVQTAAPVQNAEPTGVVVADNSAEQPAAANAPSLEGLESNTNNFNSEINAATQEQTLVIDENNANAPAQSAEPTLVIEEAPAQSEEPTLIIEDKPAEAAQPAEPVQQEPAQPQTLGSPGQPPM